MNKKTDINKSNKKNERNLTDIIVSLILGFIIVVVPLIVRLAVVKISKYEYGSIRSSSASNDVFIYCKSCAILIGTAVIVIMLFLDFITDYGSKKIHYKNPAFIAAGVYGAIALLSALFSSYKYVAVHGITERYEGVLMLLCYVALFMVMLHIVKNVKKLNYFMGCIMLSAFLIGIIGLGQFLGFDIFKTEFVTKLVYGSYYKAGSTLSVKYDSIYSTLYNPNCVGSCFALMLPLFAVLAVMLPVKSPFKYISLVLGAISVVNVIGSGSAGSLLGIGLSAAVTVVIGLVYAFKKGAFKGKGLAVFAVIIIAGGLLFAGVFKADGFSLQKVQIIFDVLSGKTVQESPYFWRDVETVGDRGVVTTAYYKVEVGKESGKPLLALDGEELDYTNTETKDGVTYFYYDLPYLEKASVIFSDDLVYFEGYDGFSTTDFMFRQTDEGMTAVVRNGQNYDLDTEVKHIGFEGLEYLGSSRGYIWSRSLPLLLNAKRFLLGSGPDTFVLEFPQTDLKGKTQYLGNPYVIVDKPHNMYLQIAINTGVFSLIAFLTLALIYGIWTVKTIFRSKNTYLNAVRLGLLSGIMAYLATNFTTDSNVGVAVFFWIMIGLGCSLNKTDFTEE